MTEFDFLHEAVGKNFVTNQFGDSYLYFVNRSIFNTTGSYATYKYHYGDSLFTENTLYILAGTDSGLLCKYIAKVGIPKGSRYVFIEPDEVLPLVKPILEEIDKAKQFYVYTPDKWHERDKLPFFSTYAYMNAVRLLQSLSVENCYFLPYRKLWKNLKTILSSALWLQSSQFTSYIFVEKQIENLAENRHPASCLRNSFKGCTAVVLAGGPSLDDTLPWVSQNRDNLFVIAVSRISKRLRQMNIEPDIVVSVDPYPTSFDFSKEMLLFSDNVIFVNRTHVIPQLLGQWRGTSLYLGNRFPWNSVSDANNINGTGLTVTSYALNIAVEMGFHQVVVAGLDLCYNKEGLTHAKGSYERDIGPVVDNIGNAVTTNGGWQADTNEAYYQSIQAIGEQAKAALNQGCEIVNPSEGAAAIENIKYCPLDNIHISPLPRPINEMLHDYLPVDDQESRILYYKELLTELAQIRYQLSKIIGLSKKALQFNEGLFGRNGMKQDFKYKLKMDTVEKKLNKEFGDLSSLAKTFGMKEFINMFKLATSDNLDDIKEDDIENSAKVYYSAYISGAHSLQNIIDASIARVESRYNEELSNPEFDQLAKQWIKDKQPGRWLVFKSRNSAFVERSLLTIRDHVNSLEKAFEDELALNDHGGMAELKQLASLAGVASQAKELFKSQDINALSRMVAGLNISKDIQAKPLYHLALGYLLELQNDPDTAVHNYVQVENHSAVEDALSRIVVITLEKHDFENALSCLQIQTKLSHFYMPRYAELLRITGRFKDAVDVYSDYLSLVPQDLTTMLKLGLLYKQIGHKEGALWVFKHIMEEDPNSETAGSLYREVLSA